MRSGFIRASQVAIRLKSVTPSVPWPNCMFQLSTLSGVLARDDWLQERRTNRTTDSRNKRRKIIGTLLLTHTSGRHAGNDELLLKVQLSGVSLFLNFLGYLTASINTNNRKGPSLIRSGSAHTPQLDAGNLTRPRQVCKYAHTNLRLITTKPQCLNCGPINRSRTRALTLKKKTTKEPQTAFMCKGLISFSSEHS
jgi:hypothetical protein